MTRRLVLLVLLLAPAAACGRVGGGEVFPGVPVILISIDTLRSDHLPAYGYQGVETPAIDALRRDGVLFEKAYSHYPLTLPSHASILTGLLPPDHGVRDNTGYTLDLEKVPYLPRELKKLGYATGGAVSSFVLRGQTGLGPGFDFYEDSIETKRGAPLGGQQRPGSETLRLASGWLDGVAKGKFFLFFHLYEPHTPYAPPEPFASRYANKYDGDVAAADAIVGRLVARLKELGVYDQALVVLLSDHGEGLGDHGEDEHGIFLYRETLQVPLLVKLPGAKRAGETVAAPAQLVDVLPTVLRLVGGEVPAAAKGTPLLDPAAETAPRPIYAETWFARQHMGWSELTSVIRGDRHFIQAPTPELYDLAADPGEKTNILTRERRTYAALREEVERFAKPLAKPEEVDPETAQKLAALGYLASPALGADEGALPDPKTQLHVLADLTTAGKHFFRKEYAQAIPILLRILADNPRMQDPREQLALSYWRLGRFGEAAAAYEEALRLSGGSTQFALNLAALYQEMGRLEEARQHAELGLASSPAQARWRLADIALAAKDFDGAERHARAAVVERGSQVQPLVGLAQVLARRGKVGEALGLVQQAEAELTRREEREDPAGFHLVYGDVLARQGRAEAAKREFLEELRRYPENLDAHTRLAVLYVSSGNPQEGVRVLRQMVEENRSASAYAAAVETLRVLGDARGAADLLRHARRAYPSSEQLRALAG
ncbi:MAG TPA: sulfatase-like hydrolase/transferase [Thermoanaerobaculia bacterium]|nr:sulfatase-like hydrolase/transferase [Thermoanaerobaculia bacterium]